MSFIRPETIKSINTRSPSSSFTPTPPDQADETGTLDTKIEQPNDSEPFEEMSEDAKERYLVAQRDRVAFLRELGVPDFRSEGWGHWSLSDYSNLQLRGKTYCKVRQFIFLFCRTVGIAPSFCRIKSKFLRLKIYTFLYVQCLNFGLPE